jgi:transposase
VRPSSGASAPSPIGAAVLETRPRARTLIEASTDSEWVAWCLEAPGHEFIVADPNVAPM